jgi:hypothetical protein
MTPKSRHCEQPVVFRQRSNLSSNALRVIASAAKQSITGFTPGFPLPGRKPFAILIPFLPFLSAPARGDVAQGAAGQDGLLLDLYFDSFESARAWLLLHGSGLEVLSPIALRCSMQDYAEQILGLYAKA